LIQCEHSRADVAEHLERQPPIDRADRESRRRLVEQAGNADHEELVEHARDDRAVADALRAAAGFGSEARSRTRSFSASAESSRFRMRGPAEAFCARSGFGSDLGIARHPSTTSPEPVRGRVQDRFETLGSRTRRCVSGRPFFRRSSCSSLIGFQRSSIAWIGSDGISSIGSSRCSARDATASVGELGVVGDDVHSVSLNSECS